MDGLRQRWRLGDTSSEDPFGEGHKPWPSEFFRFKGSESGQLPKGGDL